MYRLRHEQHIRYHIFCVGDKMWLHINKEHLQGVVKKFKHLRYRTFDITYQVIDNVFKLNQPPNMRKY